MYRYRVPGQSITLDAITVRFPAEGQAEISGSAAINGSSYSAALAGGVVYESGSIVASGPTDVNVEGFALRGERHDQAVTELMRYLNAMLDAAPGLTVISARVIEGGVEVRGVAPDRLINPAPVPLGNTAALADESVRRTF